MREVPLWTQKRVAGRPIHPRTIHAVSVRGAFSCCKVRSRVVCGCHSPACRTYLFGPAGGYEIQRCGLPLRFKASAVLNFILTDICIHDTPHVGVQQNANAERLKWAIRNPHPYRDTSLTRDPPPEGLYSSPMPRDPWWSWGWGLFFMSKVLGLIVDVGNQLYRADPARVKRIKRAARNLLARDGSMLRRVQDRKLVKLTGLPCDAGRQADQAGALERKPLPSLHRMVPLLVAPRPSRPYRGTLLIRNRAPLRTYSRPMPRTLWWSDGGGSFA